MGCACNGSSRSGPRRQQQAAASSGGNAYQWEVTYNDSTTARFDSESEAQGALAFKGGGYRMVPRNG